MNIELKCPHESCAMNTQYVDSQYDILAVFRGTIVGKISALTVAPRNNCFAKLPDGRYGYLSHSGMNHIDVHMIGTIAFREYDYATHLRRAKERCADEYPVKFDVVIARNDRIIVITGVRPAINNLEHLELGKAYDFRGNEEYHACNHCEEESC